MSNMADWGGEISHPYTLGMLLGRVKRVLFTMGGYDAFLTGSFWFFRGLLIASILFLIVYKIIDSTTKLKPVIAVTIICCIAVSFNAIRFAFDFKIPFIPQGGLREIWGMFFFGIGVLYRYYEEEIGNRWGVTAVCFFILLIGAWFGWCGMYNEGSMQDIGTLPLTGIAGFLVVKHVSTLIDKRGGRISRTLDYIGDNTLYILIFHTITFKAVSALKIWWYGLDWGQIGCHMVIHYKGETDLFWILYSIVGVALPLGFVWLWNHFITPGYRCLFPAFTAVSNRRDS